MAKDLFSGQASTYAQYRPGYPAELYDYALSFVKEKKRVWDCATGNGQAAVVLAGYFEQVHATDISEKQLQQAPQRPNIIYRVCPAENSGFPDQYFDCITVAQAYHWFRFDAFHREVLRVAKPGAVVAVWGYGLAVCSEEPVNRLFQSFYRDTIGPYWDPERKMVDDHYATVPFPFRELPARHFTIMVEWNLEQFRGYLNTWSAVQHYIRQNVHDPVDAFIEQVKQIWTTEMITFRFPVFLRLGSVE